VKGSTFKRCACKGEDGRQLGNACPKLKNPRHGTWYYQARVPGELHPVKKGGFRTQADADAALTALRAKVAAGQDLEAAKQTVAAYLDSWLAGKADLKDSTRTSYTTHIALYLKPALGDLRLEELRDHHVEELYAAMRLIGTDVARPSPVLRRILAARTRVVNVDKPLSAARIRRVHATLMSALNSAVKRRKLVHNPAEHVELASGKAPKAVVWTAPRIAEWKKSGKRYPVAVWTPELAGAFLDAVADDRLYALWHLIAFRGLRRGEAVSLVWSDVDLDAGTARVAGTKSEKSDRTISVDLGTVEALRSHRVRQLQERMAWGSAWTDTGRVFVREDGTALNPDVVSDRFDRLIVVTKSPPIRLHDLRHTAASLTYRATRDLKVVQELMGHSGIQITGDIYTSVFAEVDQAAAEAVALLVPRAPRVPSAAAVCPSRAHTAPDGVGDRRAARAKPQVSGGGAGEVRTRDRGIMSPLL
jgi:integrase